MKINLECLIRSPEVVELFKDYENDYLYYLNHERLELDPSLKVRNHSPSGFRHGYSGSGPAQLALAICLKLYGEPVARAIYQHFKQDFIAALPLDKEFSLEVEVPLNPLAQWKIPEESIHRDGPATLEAILEEEKAEELTAKQANQVWEERLEQDYINILRLPGDQRFDFHIAPGRAKDAYCFVRILNPTQQDPYVTVVATDPGDDDAGMSITNAAEMVAQQVCEAFSIPLEKLRWIERYVDKPSLQAYRRGRGNIEQRWDEVLFRIEEGQSGKPVFCHPDWKPADKNLIATLEGMIYR